ncbi:exopolysaccharide polymerization protein [Bifidobacterium scardovii]|uniref:Exopolysaccharide polymerization protein n=2 Tax=Bifidobacterium scardovii TaxID=158787 RepID=A0A087D334_9BIFI|nr:exopolysaccharide polymerization protein [Bifidobacterium scardovii]
MTAGRGLTVGTDNISYFNIFSWRQLYDSQYCPMEFGYCSLNRVLADHGFSFQIIFVIESIVLYMAIFIFTKTMIKESMWSLLPLLFFTLQPFFNALNTSRQYFALGFALIAFVLAYKKKYIFSIICFIVAFSIHYAVAAVLLLAVLVPMLRSSWSSTVILGAYLVSFFVRIIGPEKVMGIFTHLISKYSHYASGNQFDAMGSFQYILFTILIPNIIFVFCLLFDYFVNNRTRNSLLSDKDISIFHSREILLGGSLAYVCLLNAFVGSMSLARFADFFIIFLISYFLYVLSSMDDKRLVMFVVLVIIVTSFISCYYFIGIRGYQSVVPYILME